MHMRIKKSKANKIFQGVVAFILISSLSLLIGCTDKGASKNSTTTPTATTTTTTTTQTSSTTLTEPTYKNIDQTSNETSRIRNTKNTTTQQTVPSRSGAWVITTTTSPGQSKEVIDPLTGKPRYVIRVAEEYNGIGLKAIVTYWSDGCATSIVECRYCHELPCPYGGKEKCPEYDIKLDTSKTCSNCGRPIGNGYNGTCYRTIDWDNGGKLVCHHYD